MPTYTTYFSTQCSTPPKTENILRLVICSQFWNFFRVCLKMLHSLHSLHESAASVVNVAFFNLLFNIRMAIFGQFERWLAVSTSEGFLRCEGYQSIVWCLEFFYEFVWKYDDNDDNDEKVVKFVIFAIFFNSVFRSHKSSKNALKVLSNLPEMFSGMCKSPYFKQSEQSGYMLQPGLKICEMRAILSQLHIALDEWAKSCTLKAAPAAMNCDKTT